MKNKEVVSNCENFDEIVGKVDCPVVYEVVRIISGVPLFIEDHYNRLQHSFSINGWNQGLSAEEFSGRMDELRLKNSRENGNVRFRCCLQSDELYWEYSFISHTYPDKSDYDWGVCTDILYAERENPNAKVVQNTVRERANQLIGEKQLYEVLLVDRFNQITEGSRSNVFFVKDGVFYTAPAAEVLVGITRIKVFDCLKKLNLAIIEQSVSVDNLGDFDSAFITGTSPKVLPVRSIGLFSFQVRNPAVDRLIKEYDELINRYIAGKRNAMK